MTSRAAELAPDESDCGRIAAAILANLEMHHEAERELLVALLDAARGRAAPEGAEEELRGALSSLRRHVSAAGDPAEAVALLEEAAGLRTALLTRVGQCESCEAAELAVLASLQEIQLAETAGLMAKLQGLNAPAQLHALHAEGQASLVPQQNVGRVLFGAPEGASEATGEVVEALEAKYDALRDKLLLEGLMRSVGEARWAAMSERERQAELLKVKREARSLERAGKKSEADALLLRVIGDSDKLREAFAESADEQRARLDARRKELREARKASGLPANQAAIEEALEAEETARRGLNVLERLQLNFDAECRALIGSLSAQSDAAEAERQRQLHC